MYIYNVVKYKLFGGLGILFRSEVFVSWNDNWDATERRAESYRALLIPFPNLGDKDE